MACLAARKGNKNDYYQQDQQNQKKEKHRNIKCQDKRLPRVREQKSPGLKLTRNFSSSVKAVARFYMAAYKMAYWSLLKSGMREIAGND